MAAILRVKDENGNVFEVPALVGTPAKINGVNTLTIVAGNGISLSQSGSTLTINGSGSSGSDEDFDCGTW